MSYYKYGLSADPSFQMGMALGNAYGTMWANNAKQRQAKQLDDYINQQRNADFMAEINAAQPEVADRKMEEAHAALNFDLSKGSTPMLDRLDRKSGVDKALDAIAQADSQGAINYMKKQEGMSALDRAKQTYKNLDVDSVTAWAKQNGINQEVLNERLPALQKEVATNVSSLMIPEITKNLYSGNVDNILTGMQQLDELKQYDPASYERYSKIADQQLARRQAFNDSVALANAKGSRQGNKLNYMISDAALKNYSDELNALNEKMALLEDNQELSPQEQARYNWLTDMLNYGQAERSYSLGMHQVPKQLPQEKQEESKPNRPAQNLFESWWNEVQLFPDWEQNENGLKQKLANLKADDVAKLAKEKDRERMLAMRK